MATMVSGRQTVCMQHCFDQLLQNVVTASQGSNVNELGHKRANRRSSEGKALEGDLQRVCVSLIQQYLVDSGFTFGISLIFSKLLETIFWVQFIHASKNELSF